MGPALWQRAATLSLGVGANIEELSRERFRLRAQLLDLIGSQRRHPKRAPRRFAQRDMAVRAAEAERADTGITNRRRGKPLRSLTTRSLSPSKSM